MSKIAFFSKYLPSDKPSGVSVQVHRLAQQLVKNGHNVTCFSFSPRPSDALYTVEQLVWRGRSKLFRKLYPAIAFRKIPVEPFDIVHYHGDDYLCEGIGKRVRTFYGSAFDEALHAAKISRFLYQALFYFFEWVSCFKKGTLVGISYTTKKKLPLVKNVIPCSVPIDIYKPSNHKTNYPSLLFLGDLDSRKRGRLLLETFENEVLSEFPDCILTVVGPQCCNGKNIKYLENCSEYELIEQYQKSWIYCMTSSYEGFGVPVIEASACGCAVVATINSGILEVITDNVNGLLCTPESLGETIKRLIRDGGLRNVLINNGLKTGDSFSSEKIASCYETIFMKQLQE
jgi:glycosyltransferase involved in cell wall biosynthesis